jgi:hypothetical protein
MRWHLLRMTRRRAGPVAGACVLLTGGGGACVLLGAGTAQAAICPGTPVTAGTACTDTGTLTFTAGTLSLTSPVALTWAAVPGSAAAATYTSTVTLEVVSAP